MPMLLIISKGFFDGSATKFKENVLSKGTEHPMTLYKRFRGQEPKRHIEEQGFYKIL
jgi:Zn-dependent oligopeptidase